MSDGAVIPPGATIGVFGGGQLGRMLALAAARLGYRTHIYCDERDAPASHVAGRTTVAGYGDRGSLDRFAAAVNVVTLEFENVPLQALEHVAARVPVRPGAAVLAAAQDRVAEKALMARNGVATTRWAAVNGPDMLAAAHASIGPDAVLKTARLGYDGKGQVRLTAASDPAAAWRAMGGGAGILEAWVDFACEISVILARGADGATAVYDAVENRHRNHILDSTVVPARIDRATADTARGIAIGIARALDLVGLLAVEMFVTREGRVLVNEIAPRAAQFGPLDARRLRHQPVRTDRARRVRFAAGSDRPSRRRGDAQSAGRSHRRLGALARRARSETPYLRQGRIAARPQDGACDAARPPTPLTQRPRRAKTAPQAERNPPRQCGRGSGERVEIRITSAMRRSRKACVAANPSLSSPSQQTNVAA